MYTCICWTSDTLICSVCSRAASRFQCMCGKTSFFSKDLVPELKETHSDTRSASARCVTRQVFVDMLTRSTWLHLTAEINRAFFSRLSHVCLMGQIIFYFNQALRLWHSTEAYLLHLAVCVDSVEEVIFQSDISVLDARRKHILTTHPLLDVKWYVFITKLLFSLTWFELCFST